jgi:hypothetical protein
LVESFGRDADAIGEGLSYLIRRCVIAGVSPAFY